MKRYGNIFDDLTSTENLTAAHYEARVGKGKYRQVRKFDEDVSGNVTRLRESLVSGTWNVHPYRQFLAFDSGKVRVVDWNPCYSDNVVQHAIERTAGRILLASGITDTYAGIRGRGIHKGVQRIRHFLSEYLEIQNIYILKMDIRKFYASIDHDVLKLKIRRKIKDRRVLELFDKIIDSHSPGLPIGNYISQLLANYYLSDYDHWVKDQGFRHYARYCDDIVVIHHDKQTLQRLKHDSLKYLSGIHLTVKENHQVFPIERAGLDFLGYVFTRKKVLLRKSVERKFRRVAYLFHKSPTIRNYRRLGAYWGWIKWLSSGERFWYSFFNKPLKQLEAKNV